MPTPSPSPPSTQPPSPPVFLFVGLGNPEAKYAATRHNLGFMTIDHIVAHYQFENWREKFSGVIASGIIDTTRVFALKPMTYMNESGISIAAAMKFYKIAPTNIFVFYDEIDLGLGKLRVRQGGGTAGHNGVRSVKAHIGDDFQRIRIGIGRPANDGDVAQYVLRNFAKSDQNWLTPMLEALTAYAPLLTETRANTYQTRVSEAVRDARAIKGA